MTARKFHLKRKKRLTICRERGNIFKQSASRSFTSEISGLRKQYGMRGWRNWQTRTFEVRVVYPWGFESPPSHQKPVHIVCWFFFLCEGGDLEQGGGIYAASKATVRLCLACGSQPVGMSIRGVPILYRFLFCAREGARTGRRHLCRKQSAQCNNYDRSPRLKQGGVVGAAF